MQPPHSFAILAFITAIPLTVAADDSPPSLKVSDVRAVVGDILGGGERRGRDFDLLRERLVAGDQAGERREIRLRRDGRAAEPDGAWHAMLFPDKVRYIGGGARELAPIGLHGLFCHLPRRTRL